MWDIAFFTAFFAILLLPFTPAIKEWLLKKDATPLWRVSTNDEVRHFSDRFKVFADKELSMAFIKDSYKIITPDSEFSAARSNKLFRVIDKKVYVPESVRLPDNNVYTQEIYAKSHVEFGRKTKIYAALVLGNVKLDDECIVTRWLQANVIEVGESCKLFGRVSADKKIEIKSNCIFSRLNAPIIEFGAQDNIDREDLGITQDRQKDISHLRKVKCELDAAGRCIINGDCIIPPYSLISCDLIVRGSLKISHGSLILGNIKAYKSISIESRVTIEGSIVSRADILAGDWSYLQGPVISEKNVKLGHGATVGSVGQSSTITALAFACADNVLVYGTINVRLPEIDTADD